MASAAAIAAWEREGLRLLGTCAAPDDRAALRASAERIAVAARARSAPGFERCAALACLFMPAPELCALSACSRSAERIAKADHLWSTLTACTFSSARELRQNGFCGFREFSRLARLWNFPNLSPSWIPELDAYSIFFEIKLSGRRVAGGLFDVPEEDAEAGPLGCMVFRDFDPTGRLRPAALASAWPSIGDLTPLLSVSVCVVRKSDQKYLHIVTDLSIDPDDLVYDDRILFDGPHFDGPHNIHETTNCISRFWELSRETDENNVGWAARAEHDFSLYGAFWDAEDDSLPMLRGFEESRAELRLYDYSVNQGQSKDVVLRRWHESKNWL